jgi:hypothetical protein
MNTLTFNAFDMDISLLYLLLFGVIVGLLGTLIGAGGGFLMMPVFLIFYKERDPAVLTAISLAVICANAVSGSIAYAKMKRIDYRAGLFFALAATPGAIAGAIATKYISIETFNAMFAVILIAVAGYLFISADGQVKNGRADAKTIGPYNMKLGMLISTAVGFLSSILGIGGGIIHVPMMVYLLQFPVHFATATSHFTLAIMTFVGTVVHIAQGDLKGEWFLVVPLAVGVIAGAQAGAKLSQRIKSVQIIKFLAISLMLVGIRVIYQVF